MRAGNRPNNIFTRNAQENDDLLDAADHGGSLVPELNRVMAQRIEQLHKSIMCNIDDHCNEVIKKKLVKPKVVRKVRPVAKQKAYDNSRFNWCQWQTE
jgi:hypothetical protein